MNIADTPLPSYSDTNAHDLNEETRGSKYSSKRNALSKFVRTELFKLFKTKNETTVKRKRKYTELEDNPIVKQEKILKLIDRSSEMTDNRQQPPITTLNPILKNQFSKVFSDPTLSEQLSDIRQLLGLKFSDMKSNIPDELLNHCLKEISDHYNFELTKDHQKEVSVFLGKILFLLNLHPNLALQILNLKTYDEIDVKVTEILHQSSLKAIQRLQTNFEQHCLTLLQHPEVSTKTQIPIEIAKLLLTDTGAFNLGITDTIQVYFLGRKKEYLNYDLDIIRTLHYLEQFKDLRKKLRNLSAPPNPNSPINDVIRIMLQLGPDEKITDQHARVALLATMMSHMRQGPSGSCFATFLSINLLKENPLSCLEDFSSLINSSKLSRTVNEVTVDFPCLLSTADKNLASPFKLDRTGRIIGPQTNSLKLWNAPGIKAACLAIGIENMQEKINECLLQIFPKDQSITSIKTTPEKIIKLLSEIKAPNIKLNSDQKYSMACFAFSAQTNGSLLKVWRNSIAAMSEAEKGKIKTSIIRSIQNTLSLGLRQAMLGTGQIPQKLYDTIHNDIVQNTYLQYDPKGCFQLTPDEHSSEGAFILFDKNHSISPLDWIRINTPVDFKEFLGRVLERSLRQLENSICDDSQSIDPRTMDWLAGYIKTDACVIHILWQYHPQNLLLENLSTLNKHHQYTPWHTNSGNDASKVLQTYNEQNSPPKILKQVNANGERLLETIIKLAQEHLIDKNKEPKSSQLLPARLPGKHSFTVLLEDPSLISLAKDQNLEIRQRILEAGENIAKSLISLQTKQGLLSYAEHLLENPELIILFRQFIPSDIDNLNIRQFRDYVLDTLKRIKKCNPDEGLQIALKLDTHLISILPPQLKQQFIESAVHIADTNWQEGVHDIHFCLAFNPGSGRLELMEAYDDNSYWRTLNQKEWVDEQPWEFFSYNI